ncbi:unnamed protein product [Pleuronectes platessa]|uniref:tRNA (34-2'-O)-methyltransferase regulator WDR6 n=1 Tax=Pleuronectes platessa TaxID=8262 RepID=A0A9N7YIH8_PLEPL|nr:unnamed protein product [Pleuronectes platessa]
MKAAALVAPVTAVHFIKDLFLLTGEGPVLTVYSLEPRPKASASLSVLQHYRIHGVRPRRQDAVTAQKTHGLNSTKGPNLYDLAVFGGKAVRLVRLHVGLQDGNHLHLEVLGPLMELQDWALDVHWLSGDKPSLLCVALAHNSALLLDVNTGTALVQRSCLEGCLLYSALLLVHESWADVVLVGGTVFNQLVVWKPGGGDGGGDSHSKCKAPVERRLLGHSGVIFNISYLQERGWLASASDDRSVRVWGVGVLGGPGGKCGDQNPTCLRVLYGHQARVFSVRLSPGKVFSAGEDGACLVWDWAGGGKVVRTLKGHRAGGVRSLAVSEGTEEERWVATGGADGGVRLWRLQETEEKTEEAVTDKLTDLKFPGHSLPKVVCVAGEEDENESWSQSKIVVCTDQGTVYQYSNGTWETLWQGTPDFHSYCVMETVCINVKDSTTKVNLCAVGNLSGSIQVFPISHPHAGILLSGGSGKIHSLIWKEGGAGMCLLASGAGGIVYRWCVEKEEKLHEKKEMMHRQRKRTTRGFSWRFCEFSGPVKVWSGWRKFLILQPEIPEEEEAREEGENHSKTGGEDAQAENEAREARFVIAGFHAVHFVVWDPVRQERLFEVPCGGGHRSWVLWPSHKRVWPGYGALVFIKHGAVLASHPPGEEGIWAGRTGRTGGWGLREGIHGRGVGCVCRLGMIEGSGCDIQTTATMTATERKEVEREHWEVLVTGGEDTSLTVLAVHPNSGNIKVLSVITDHISSVRTVTAIKHAGGERAHQSQSLSTLLFSAGGRAQMQCYRLLIGWDQQRLTPSCQVIQVASHRLDEQWERKRNRHKTVKMDPETRYMSIVVVDQRTDCVLLALACSDGAVRLFSVNEGKHRIDLLWETFHHQRCVLSVATCSLEDGKGNRYKLLFSAATDGKIAVWDLTDASSSKDTSIDAPTPPTPCLDIPAHQSGISSLAVCAEELGLEEGGCLVTVASGGDDGQLTVSTIRVHYPEDGQTGGSRELSQISQPEFQTPNQLKLHLHGHSHIPLAHAAPITAVKLLTPGLMVSTSSDQRVCLWRVSSTGISHRETLFSHVADAAGLSVWEGQMTDSEEGDENTIFKAEEISVCGEGIEAGLETERKSTEPEEAGRFRNSDERGGETGNQTPTEGVVKREGDGKDCCESRKRREKTGWVLVCGQGLQLLREKHRSAQRWLK